jgi:hypothetical protein
MHSRWIPSVTRALALMLVASVVTIGPASAARPTRPAPAPPDAERPLSAEERAASDRKLAAALAYLAAADAAGATVLSLDCVTPQAGGLGPAPDACYVPSDFLPVEARDQIRGHYCGPAVGQVIANYTWAVAAGANRYAQTTIAGWMQTDVNGLTNAPELEDGLERATSGAPRRPAGWDWVVTDVRDLNANGTTGDELQGFVRANVTGSNMPLAIPVKPHDPRSKVNLSSWPNAVASAGHWIAAYGWYSAWTGTDFARVYYTDSSKDEGGSTGKFWNSTKSLATLIAEHTGRLVW